MEPRDWLLAKGNALICLLLDLVSEIFTNVYLLFEDPAKCPSNIENVIYSFGTNDVRFCRCAFKLQKMYKYNCLNKKDKTMLSRCQNLFLI